MSLVSPSDRDWGTWHWGTWDWGTWHWGTWDWGTWVALELGGPAGLCFWDRVGRGVLRRVLSLRLSGRCGSGRRLLGHSGSTNDLLLWKLRPNDWRLEL